MSYPLVVDWNMQMSHINEVYNSEVWSWVTLSSGHWRLYNMHASLVWSFHQRMQVQFSFFTFLLGSLVASSGRVDNAVDKCIAQTSQAIGALQKSVCLDNPLYCMWRPGTPYAEICSSFIYYSMWEWMDGMGKHIWWQHGWNVMYSEAMAEECLEGQQQRFNQHDKRV